MKRMSMFLFSVVLLSVASNNFCMILPAKGWAKTKESSDVLLLPDYKVSPKIDSLRPIHGPKLTNKSSVRYCTTETKKAVVVSLIQKGYVLKKSSKNS